MAHSRISASASSRWIACPGSIELVEHLREVGLIPQESKSSAAAELGTAVHYIIEQVLLGKKQLRNFRGKFVKVEGMTNKAKITSKEILSARLCVNYVKAQMDETPRSKMFPERKYDLSNVYDMPIGGTSDVTIVQRRGLLHIIDYKNGRVFVDQTDNSQLKIYALGAYYHFRNKYKFKRVKLTIVQPNTKVTEESIRSEEFDLEDLLHWERKVLVVALAHIQSKKAIFNPDKDKQCFWCEAKGHCPAYEKEKPILADDVASSLLPLSQSGALPTPDSLSSEELGFVLQNADLVLEFYSSCKKVALQRLEENSSAIDGWTLQAKLGNRKFVSDDKLKTQLKKKKLSFEDLMVHEDRQMSVTELEKHLVESLKWDKDQVMSFMDSVTERNKSGYVLKPADSPESDFSEFATKPETKKTETRKKVKRNGRRSA